MHQNPRRMGKPFQRRTWRCRDASAADGRRAPSKSIGRRPSVLCAGRIQPRCPKLEAVERSTLPSNKKISSATCLGYAHNNTPTPNTADALAPASATARGPQQLHHQHPTPIPPAPPGRRAAAPPLDGRAAASSTGLGHSSGERVPCLGRRPRRGGHLWKRWRHGAGGGQAVRGAGRRGGEQAAAVHDGVGAGGAAGDGCGVLWEGWGVGLIGWSTGALTRADHPTTYNMQPPLRPAAFGAWNSASSVCPGSSPRGALWVWGFGLLR